MFKKEKIIGVIVILGKVYMFFRLAKPVFLLTQYVGLSMRPRWEVAIFIRELAHE